MSTTTFPPSDPLTWKQADTDVHVATRGGEFAGFVEFDGSAHLVRDNHGAELGVFDSLDDCLPCARRREPAFPTWARLSVDAASGLASPHPPRPR